MELGFVGIAVLLVLLVGGRVLVGILRKTRAGRRSASRP